MTDFVFRVGQCEGKFFVQASDKKDMYLFKNGIVENWHIMGGKIGYETNDKDSFFDTLDDANAAIANYKRDSKKKYKYDFPMAGMTADCIIRCEDKVLLIKRKYEPFASFLAMPGGFVNIQDELIEDACIREMKEETNLDIFPKFFMYADAISRDPRQRTVSFIFESIISKQQSESQLKAGDDAESFVWIQFDSNTIANTNLAFDHQDILLKFLATIEQ